MTSSKKPVEKILNQDEHPAGTLFLAYRYDEDCTLKLTTCKVNMWAPSGAFVNVNGEWRDTPVDYVEILPMPVGDIPI